MKRGGGSEEVDKEVVEEEEEDGVRVGGGEGVGVVVFRSRREDEFGDAGGVSISCFWKARLDGRGWAGDLAAPWMPR